MRYCFQATRRATGMQFFAQMHRETSTHDSYVNVTMYWIGDNGTYHNPCASTKES